jgi:molybdenum cofactor cytidylyltransferase
VAIAAILLAAGESTRMGRLKQLLPWGGTTLIDWQVRQFTQAGVDSVVVVLGHAADDVRPALPSWTRVALNEDYRQGRASSLRRGAQAVDAAPEAVLILSVDQPRPAWLSKRLIDRWRLKRPLIVSPRFVDGFGHPVLLDGSLLPELRDVDERSLGLRAVIDRHLESAAKVVIRNFRINVDLNTPDDYASALASFNSGEWAKDE